MDDFQKVINDAVASHDYVTLVLAILVVAVPAGLKLAGKDVPVLDPIIAGLKAVISSKAKVVQIPPPAPGEKTGVEAVVKVEDAPTDEKKP